MPHKEIRLLLLVTLLISSYSLPMVASGESPRSNSAPGNLLTYEGVLLISIWGERLVEEYLNASEYCNTRLTWTLLIIRYIVKVEVSYDRHGVISVENVSLANTEVSSSHACIAEQVKHLLEGLSELVESRGSFNIILTFNRSHIRLEEASRNGEVVGVLRFDLDVVQIMRVEGDDISELNKYNTRYTLYYEPLTGIPLHVVNTYVESFIDGSVSIVNSISLISGRGFFKHISRRVYEIVSSGRDVNRTAPLILIYFSGEESIEPVVKAEGDTISIRFTQPTRCFIQFEPVGRVVYANVPLVNYSVSNRHIYFTSTSTPCNLLTLSFDLPQDAELYIKEVEEFIERGMPPRIPNPSLPDVVSILAIFGVILSWFYLVVREVVYRLIK